jgi:hypothetical protein
MGLVGEEIMDDLIFAIGLVNVAIILAIEAANPNVVVFGVDADTFGFAPVEAEAKVEVEVDDGVEVDATAVASAAAAAAAAAFRLAFLSRFF